MGAGGRREGSAGGAAQGNNAHGPEHRSNFHKAQARWALWQSLVRGLGPDPPSCPQAALSFSEDFGVADGLDLLPTFLRNPTRYSSAASWVLSSDIRLKAVVAAGRSTADAVLLEADCFEADQPIVSLTRALSIRRRYRSTSIVAAMEDASVEREPWRDATWCQPSSTKPEPWAQSGGRFFPAPAMFKPFGPMGLALAGTLMLPLGASAVPIHAANGVAETTPNQASCPRRPGPIPQASQTTDLSTQSSNGRGRPVPGKASFTADKALAEGTPLQIQ
jgi:hypothetical protein